METYELPKKKHHTWDLFIALQDYLNKHGIDIDDINCQVFVFSHDDKVCTISFGTEIDR